jgi:hypothetical protein
LGIFSHAAIAENATASASAQITLQLLPRVEMRPVVIGGIGNIGAQLCLQRIPADNYQVLIWSAGSSTPDSELGTQGQGHSGAHCLSPEVTATTESILILAQ